MKTQQNFGRVVVLVVAMVVAVFTNGCVTRYNVTTEATSIGPDGTNTFKHTNKTLKIVQPDWVGGDGTVVSGHFRVGGGSLPPRRRVYGYDNMPNSGAWPTTTQYPWEVGRDAEETWRAYGGGGPYTYR